MISNWKLTIILPRVVDFCIVVSILIKHTEAK